MWGEIMIPMCRLWLHNLYGPWCLRKAVKLNHSLTCEVECCPNWRFILIIITSVVIFLLDHWLPFNSTEMEMLSFWQNFHHCVHWKLSFWQLSVHPVMNISSKWHTHFREQMGLGHASKKIKRNPRCEMLHGVPAWISNPMSNIVWGEITYSFPNFSSCMVEVWEWISNFIPLFIMDVITYPCWNQS